MVKSAAQCLSRPCRTCSATPHHLPQSTPPGHFFPTYAELPRHLGGNFKIDHKLTRRHQFSPHPAQHATATSSLPTGRFAMAARLSIWSTCRALAVRSRPIIVSRSKPFGNVVASTRWYADESDGGKLPPKTTPESKQTSSSQTVPPSEQGSLEPAEQPAARAAAEAAEAVWTRPFPLA